MEKTDPLPETSSTCSSQDKCEIHNQVHLVDFYNLSHHCISKTMVNTNLPDTKNASQDNYQSIVDSEKAFDRLCMAMDLKEDGKFLQLHKTS